MRGTASVADLAEPGVTPFQMRGRPVDGWVRVDPAVLGSDEALARWVAVGRACVASLPRR